MTDEITDSSGCVFTDIGLSPVDAVARIAANRGAEITKLKAQLAEAIEIIHFTAQHGAFPSGIKHRARAFLDKAGE